MIRFVPVLFAALFAINAQATPKLGDYAAFDLNVTQNGQAIQGTLEQEIVQANGSQFLERQTVTVSGQAPQVNDSWKAASDYLDDATIDSILANCAAAGGTVQNITVPAGNYATCALNFDNEENQGTAWVAKVPFGVAQLVSTTKANGMVVNAQLRTFR